jgi:hypothetical protein
VSDRREHPARRPWAHELLHRHVAAGLQGRGLGPEFTWDPEQPGQTVGGLPQLPCAAHANPCTIRSFIGDYFGLAISDNNVYALFVSTHYPSIGRVADGGGPVYDQAQVLATVPRSTFGAGY